MTECPKSMSGKHIPEFHPALKWAYCKQCGQQVEKEPEVKRNIRGYDAKQRAKRIAEGERERERGIALAISGSPDDWRLHARRVVNELAKSRVEFTADDVLERIPQDIPQPRDNRALGAILRSCGSKGWIELTDKFVPSTNPKKHRSPTRVWRSLLTDQSSLLQ